MFQRRLILGLALALFANAASAEDAVVKIDNFTFNPAAITVHIGTKVVWENGDDIPHTVTEKDRGFKSPALDTGDSFAFTFASKGEFDYFCSLHPHMVGKVIVVD